MLATRGLDVAKQALVLLSLSLVCSASHPALSKLVQICGHLLFSLLVLRTPRLIEWVRVHLCRIRASQLVEDANQRQRHAETQTVSKVVSPDKVFAALITKRVLGEVHHYDEVANVPK
jgi:hypothetical protein